MRYKLPLDPITPGQSRSDDVSVHEQERRPGGGGFRMSAANCSCASRERWITSEFGNSFLRGFLCGSDS